MSRRASTRYPRRLRGVWIPVRSIGSYACRDAFGAIIVAPMNASGTRSRDPLEWATVEAGSEHHAELEAALDGIPATLPAVQAIAMRLLLRAWRTRYSLHLSELRRKTPRTITWATLYGLQQKGLIKFNPMSANWHPCLWHGRPVVRVGPDGKVVPVRAAFSDHLEEQERVAVEQRAAVDKRKAQAAS